MGRRFAPLELDEVEHAELTSLASRRSTAQALALRARIVLACAEGEQGKVVATRCTLPDREPSVRILALRPGVISREHRSTMKAA